MNWSFLWPATNLPLVVAMVVALALGSAQAIRLNRQGGSSREALWRLLRSMGIAFTLTLLLASVWNSRRILRGLVGVALGRPADQRAMGLLRAKGDNFLTENQAKAAYWFRKAAEGGDADGQLLLAQAMLQGQGLPRDPGGALSWIQTAAGQGRPDAMVLAGDLAKGEDALAANAWYERALPAFRQRIQSGDADACLNYGLMYTTGKGVEKNRTEGLAWMLVARRLGLDPYKGIIIVLCEAKLSQSQRAEASQRAVTILKSLPSRRASSIGEK